MPWISSWMFFGNFGANGVISDNISHLAVIAIVTCMHLLSNFCSHSRSSISSRQLLIDVPRGAKPYSAQACCPGSNAISIAKTPRWQSRL